MAEDVEATHRVVLGQRFDEYFGELRRTHRELSVSRLAEEFGYADSQFLDGLREGREYAKWDEINDFCLRSGLNASWLKHGEEHPFSPEYAELADLNALLRELEPRGDWPLYAVRSDCSEGLVCFVRRDSKYAWRIYNTTLHLSARNGGGGRMNLVRLYRFLKTLAYAGSGAAAATGLDTGWKGRIVSHTLAKSEFDTLVDGTVFPGALLGNLVQCYWADDFPILEGSDDVTRRLLASQGLEFHAAQAIVREELGRLNEDWREEAAALRQARFSLSEEARRTVACPVCGYPTPRAANADRGAEQPISVECPRCGPFRVGEGVERLVAAGRVPRTRLSAWIRAQKESAKAPPTILQEQLRGIVDSLPEHSVAEKQQLLLTVIGRRTKPSESTDLVVDRDYVIAWAESGAELKYLLDALAEEGMLEVEESAVGTSRCKIKAAGWKRLEAAKLGRRESKQVFVAMNFDEELEAVWRDGIAPALRSIGYEAYRVDKDQHLERIDVKLLAEIDRSAFVVADVTGQKQGVYFEAGYAEGQGIPVVWCVHKDEINRLHFDTRQFNHVVWQDVTDLREKLVERVEAAIGTG